jgi:hypothetical protein
MAEPGNGGDIIIKGGSVEIAFNEQTFPGNGGKYGNKERKIVAVEVNSDANQTQTVNIPSNGKCTIRIITK